MKLSAVLTLVLLVFSFSGCASIINGTSDTISITSTMPDADLYVDGNPSGGVRQWLPLSAASRTF